MRYSFHKFIKNFSPKTDKETVVNGVKYNSSKSYTRKMDSQGGTWHVRFMKVDGTIRDMLCTRDWSKLEKDKYQGYEPPIDIYGRHIPSHQVIVWDTQARGYRSFRSNSVLLFEKISSGIINTFNPKIKYTRDELIDMLNKGNYKIIFDKVNGSRRVMNCTRNIKDFKDDFKDYKNIIRVWDLDKNDYRAIKYSNIINVSKCTKQFKSE